MTIDRSEYFRNRYITIIKPDEIEMEERRKRARECKARKSLVVSLPYPQSSNAIWGKSRGGMFMKPKASAFLQEAIVKLKLEKNLKWWETFTGKLVVEYSVRHPDNREHDCDNLFKQIGDAIEKSGIVMNDRWLLPRCIDFCVDKENPGVEVKIYVFTGN